MKRVYDAGVPSVNHIFIVPGNGTGITHNYSTDTNDDYDSLSGLSSVHEFYYALVALQNGQFLASSDVLNIANALLSNISIVTTQTVVVNSGQAVQGIDFGNHALPGSINGQLWYDANGDGVKDAGEPPLAGWTVFLDKITMESLRVGHPAYRRRMCPGVFSTSRPPPRLFCVSGLPSISDLNVTLDITHTYDNDLQVYLTSPTGTRILLFGSVGQDGNNFSNTTLDDEAANSISNGAAPFAGSFRPLELLSDLRRSESERRLDAGGQRHGQRGRWRAEQLVAQFRRC